MKPTQQGDTSFQVPNYQYRLVECAADAGVVNHAELICLLSELALGYSQLDI